MLKGVLVGVVLSLMVLVGGAYVAVANGLVPARADAKPGPLETWAARTSLHATLRREAPRDPSPIAATPANLEAGMKLYAANCAVCHGTSDGQASSIAKGLYQHAPQLAKHGVEDDPIGVTYWKVKHGIRLTGMPSFTASMSDTQLWKVSLFLKHMGGLPPSVEQQWKRVPSVAAFRRGI
ncbi:cytochrome c [bacterium]|nr:MAG: cytochrome c [bacterium]